MKVFVSYKNNWATVNCDDSVVYISDLATATLRMMNGGQWAGVKGVSLVFSVFQKHVLQI